METLNKYLQNMLKFDNMKHKIYEHIINEIHDDKLHVIENDLGNPFIGIYVYNLHKNLKEFEIIVNTSIENNNFDIATVNLIKKQKQEAESLVKLRLKHYQKLGKQKAKEIIKANKQFERYFNNLFNEIENRKPFLTKKDLQESLEEVTKALIYEKNHNISSNFGHERNVWDLEWLKEDLEHYKI